VNCCQAEQQSSVRDVATCPELSYGCLNAAAVGQSKPLSASVETRTESAPSMLPPSSCQLPSAADSAYRLSASQSVPTVGTGPQMNVPRYRPDVGSGRSDVSDGASCRDIESHPVDLVPAILPRLGSVTQVDAQLPQTAVSLADDAATDAGAAAGSGVKRSREAATVDGASSSAAAADVCDVAGCSEVTMHVDVTSGIPAAAGEADAAEPTARGGTVCTEDRCSNSSTSNTTTDSGTEIEGGPALAASGPAAVDESVDMTDGGLAVEPGSMVDDETNSLAVEPGSMVDEETSVSMDQLSTSVNVDVADDATLCCVDDVIDYASNGESHSTLDDLPLVSCRH